jgi:hypothetical protein
MESVWAALQASGFAAAIRDSTFIYPIANVTHVVAVIAFFGLVAAMDLRLLGVTGGTPARAVVARLRPFAAAALVIIAMAGFILFAAEALALMRNPAFALKLTAIVLALINIAVNEWSLRRFGEGATLAKFTAGASLALWLFVAAMGRTIAYV